MAGKEEVLGAGRELFKQDEKGGDLYFIKEGEVELLVANKEKGTEAVVATMGPRSVIGTMSFLEGDPRSATARTKTEVKFVKVSQDQKDKLLATIPQWFQVLLKDLSKNLRRTNGLYLDTKGELDLVAKKVAIKEKNILEGEEKVKATERAMTDQKNQLEKEKGLLQEKIQQLEDQIKASAK